MEEFSCNQIQFKNIFILNHKVKELILLVSFENSGNFYDVYFKYVNFEWSFKNIYHSNYEHCSHCLKHVNENERLYSICKYCRFYKAKIKDELLNDKIVKQKIKNYRLEAITNGFKY
jgi:hypothetical protein